MADGNNIPGFDIDAFLASLTKSPGVYRMLGAKGEILYVGKAKNLKRAPRPVYNPPKFDSTIQAPKSLRSSQSLLTIVLGCFTTSPKYYSISSSIYKSPRSVHT